jgi:hypothetical protein
LKEYPSIPKKFTDFQAYVFDKVDGSNTRVEYSRKQGWYKFGKRHGLIDASDPMLGGMIDIFNIYWADSMTKLARDRRWDSAILFFEFVGPNSFAGCHEPADQKQLILIDAALNKQGILGPKDFLQTFEGTNHANFLGHLHWTRGLVDRVWNNDLPGITFEGVVGKSGSKHDLIMCKAKTRQWIEKVKFRYTTEEADKIINS